MLPDTTVAAKREGNKRTVGVFVRIARVIFKHDPVNDVAQSLVEVDGHLI
jgi:hypothetical protein